MTTKSSRHAMVEVNCEWCGTTFLARKQRVDKGQGRWCSRSHYKEWLQAQGSQRKNIGKENAIIQWEPTKNMYCAYWYDENMKYHSAGWARWYWELNVGKVPNGYRVSYLDENSRNNIPENIFLISNTEHAAKQGKKLKGKEFTEEHKNAIRNGRLGMKLSESHRQHIGDSVRIRWNKGMFDNVHVGENNHHWRGGATYEEYPVDFHKIKKFIRERDKNMCQICGTKVYRSRHGHVHHINGNKQDNDDSNLILLCSTCHTKVHSQNDAPPTILAFRSKLEWNKP